MVSRDEEEENPGTRTSLSSLSDISFRILWKDARNWRSHFNATKAGTALILGLAPSAYDIFSDFALAELINKVRNIVQREYLF